MAVDAGVHLGAITRILEDTQPPGLGQTAELQLPYVLRTGPFAGLKVFSASSKTNASRIHSELIDTYLITHPHLDHISAFVINTAGLSGPRRKKLAGLPGTIQALKTHIFNNVIWPNLSDEDNGAGLFTYLRLNEGGSPAMGNIDGYLEFNEGLAIKVWSVSHGHNIERRALRGSGSNTRYGSLDAQSGLMGFGTGMRSPRSIAHHNTSSPNLAGYFQQQHFMAQDRHHSVLPGSSSASGGRGSGGMMNQIVGGHSPSDVACVYDSSSYFIRDVDTGVEVLIFGDVEGDSVSMNPRNLHIWQEAAPKIVLGKLKAILIECSYDDSRPVDRLFGHLTPSFLVQEMEVLADEVKTARTRMASEKSRSATDVRRSSKRKRDTTQDDSTIASRRMASRAMARHSGDSITEPVSPRTLKAPRSDFSSGIVQFEDSVDNSPHIATPTAQLSLQDFERAYSTGNTPGGARAAADGPQLKGLKVVIIHVKDKMNDEERVEDTILDELQDHESFMDVPLGCEWVISEVGQSLEF
ncbi:putative 3',5'-cyclic-nucleotide phosphodiesterase [Cytospora mali]|uniref:3',5'-cyclic-nucleotide phosphodiesterase n=1 Tax=Cytospora mali TaxID=578113 RepID=A0A194VMH4_CYTMA|nr:putative 3',5'-cyclic-nucleotide phosphodiesterase [Valsa mali]